MQASIAVQCRQKPGTFATQRETMGFTRKMPGHLSNNCPHVDLDSIEWMSSKMLGAIPYGLLIRTWPVDNDSEHKAYSSPVDARVQRTKTAAMKQKEQEI
jgi:hypothetical protein